MIGRELGMLYQKAHDRMRDVEGLLPQEAFDELLKVLFYKEWTEQNDPSEPFPPERPHAHQPQTIRKIFSRKLASEAPWALRLWPNGAIQLLDQTLTDIHSLLSGVRLTDLSLDIRSTALRTFVSTDSRKGLGIFLTPEDVVRCMVEIAAPRACDTILDPACGSGTFLLETVRHIRSTQHEPAPITVNGIEKSARMLLLAELNLRHRPLINFRRACADSLRELGRGSSPPLGLLENSVDVILTNPPFGVTVTQDTGIPDLFGSEGTGREHRRTRVASEVLFIELCLRLLKPQGRLGIVLPRSVLTNESLSSNRYAIDQLGHITDIVDLPTETFSSAGTQTTTVAAFFTKHSEKSSPKSVSVRVSRVTNVGFDTTGRHREGNQLPHLPERLAAHCRRSDPDITLYADLDSTETLQRAAEFLFQQNSSRGGTPLREFVEMANTGRTPARSSYTDEGMFILKVGNLTGRGIDWDPRDRNFVSETEGMKRAKREKLKIREGDLVLTSSAHAARYIAKKVDIVVQIPDSYSGVTFVGEVLRIRPAPDIDPFVMLAVLRHPRVREWAQASVRGQTAHLNPNDLIAMRLPWDLRSPQTDLLEVANLLRREASIAYELSTISMRVAEMLKSTVTPSV